MKKSKIFRKRVAKDVLIKLLDVYHSLDMARNIQEDMDNIINSLKKELNRTGSKPIKPTQLDLFESSFQRNNDVLP